MRDDREWWAAERERLASRLNEVIANPSLHAIQHRIWLAMQRATTPSRQPPLSCVSGSDLSVSNFRLSNPSYSAAKLNWSDVCRRRPIGLLP